MLLSVVCSLMVRFATSRYCLPDFGTITGPFQIVALEYGGNHDAEVTFEIALESAGLITFGEAL